MRERGSKKQGDHSTIYCILIRVHNECLLCLNDTSYTCTYIIMIIGMNVVDNLNNV